MRVKKRREEEGRGGVKMVCKSTRIFFGRHSPNPARLEEKKKEKYLTQSMLRANWIRHTHIPKTIM